MKADFSDLYKTTNALYYIGIFGGQYCLNNENLDIFFVT